MTNATTSRPVCAVEPATLEEVLTYLGDAESISASLARFRARHERLTKLIRAEPDRYLGQWVALHDDEVLHSPHQSVVLTELRARAADTSETAIQFVDGGERILIV